MESTEEICKDEFYEGDHFETYSTIEVSKGLELQIYKTLIFSILYPYNYKKHMI